MQGLWQDLRYGIRVLAKNPGFTLVAIFTLALGIGANTAIFSVVYTVLLKPLPFKDPERLVLLWNRGPAAAGGDRTPLAVADLLDWGGQNLSFQTVGAFQHIFFNFSASQGPEQVRGAAVTANMFSLLGVQPQLGRGFLPAEQAVGAGAVALLSDGFWRSRFNADPQVVGQTIRLSGENTVIVGIMPAHLNFPVKEAEIWTVLQLEPPTRRGPYFLTGVGRLKPVATTQQAAVEIRAMKSSFSGESFDFKLLPVNHYVTGDVRPTLLALLLAVTLVLLIATANVANLMLVRAAARVKEISIRTALGASAGRIARQLLIESLLLALAGGVLGILLAGWGVDLLLKFAPLNLPRLDQIGIDGSVLGWTVLVSLLTGMVFGLAPAWQGSRLDLNQGLKDSGRNATEVSNKRRGQNLLVVTELALAFMLVVGAGLLVKSLWRMQQIDVGINTERVLTVPITLRGQRYEKPQQVREFFLRLVEQIQALPGVEVAAVSNSLPPDSTDFSSDFSIEGQSPSANQEARIAYFIRVSSGFFTALGTRLRSGRYFDSSDTAESHHVVLINETLTGLFFPGEDRLGGASTSAMNRIPTGTRSWGWWETSNTMV